MKLETFIKGLKQSFPKEKYLWINLLIYAQHIEQISIENISNMCKIPISDLPNILNKKNCKIKFENFEVIIEIIGSIIYFKKTKNITKVEPKTTEKQFIIKVLNALNNITGKHFKSSSRKNQTVILARIKEGYSFDEFLHVIQVQSIKWIGTSSEIYLRPETLFGTKMEGYANAPIPTKNPNANKLEKINEAIKEAKQFDWENASNNS